MRKRKLDKARHHNPEDIGHPYFVSGRKNSVVTIIDGRSKLSTGDRWYHTSYHQYIRIRNGEPPLLMHSIFTIHTDARAE